jgi:signal transduction histidine kinase
MRGAVSERRRPPQAPRSFQASGCALLDESSRSNEQVHFAGLRRPLQIILERLDRTAARTQLSYRRILRRLNPNRRDYEHLAAMDLAACCRHLRPDHQDEASRGHAAYCLAVERVARHLMRAGVPEDQAIASIGCFHEACLPHAKRPIEVRALVRLASSLQRLLAAGYGEERAKGLTLLDDRERQRLSGDLHDEVGADLVVLKLYVEMIAMELAKGSVARIGPKLQEALVLISHSIESVRRLTLDLAPAFLESLGFQPALRSVVRQFSLRTGIKVQLEEPAEPISMPPSHERAIYRVLLGALSNVAKHSHAKRVTVTLGITGGIFVMVVQDDGRGFDVSAQSPDRSFGLTAMSERVRGLHGRLYIESGPATGRGGRGGTRLEISLPLRKQEDT